MKTEITDNTVNFRGEIFYDAECPLCLKGFMRFNKLFARHGFRWLPMQTPGLAQRLIISEAELRREMKVLRSDGQVLGGIDTWSYLLRSVWWLWPVGILLLLPGIHWVANAAYGWVARNRYCISDKCGLSAPPAKRSHSRTFFELP